MIQGKITKNTAKASKKNYGVTFTIQKTTDPQIGGFFFIFD